MNRRHFIKTGLLYVPTIFACHGDTVRAGNLDHEVGDWMARARAATGNYTAKSVVASDTAIKRAKAAGLRSKILRWNLFVGDRTGSLHPLVNGAGAANDNASASMTYSEAAGWSCVNATDWITTGFNPVTYLTTNDAHMAIYLGGTAGAHGWIPMGLTGFGSDHFFLLTSYTAVGAGGPIWSATYPSTADTDGRGFYMTSRTSASADGLKVYKDGALIATSSSVGGSPPDTAGNGPALAVMNCNNAGAALGGAPTTKTGLQYHIGKGFTAADVAAMEDIWLRVKAILGR